MQARYPGRCAATGQPIKPGDEVRSAGPRLWALVSPPAPTPEPLPVALGSASRWRAAQRRQYPNAPE